MPFVTHFSLVFKKTNKQTTTCRARAVDVPNAYRLSVNVTALPVFQRPSAQNAHRICFPFCPPPSLPPSLLFILSISFNVLSLLYTLPKGTLRLVNALLRPESRILAVRVGVSDIQDAALTFKWDGKEQMPLEPRRPRGQGRRARTAGHMHLGGSRAWSPAALSWALGLRGSLSALGNPSPAGVVLALSDVSPVVSALPRRPHWELRRKRIVCCARLPLLRHLGQRIR